MTVDQLRRFLSAIDGGIGIQVAIEDMDLDVISVEYNGDSDAITLYCAEPLVGGASIITETTNE